MFEARDAPVAVCRRIQLKRAWSIEANLHNHLGEYNNKYVYEKEFERKFLLQVSLQKFAIN